MDKSYATHTLSLGNPGSDESEVVAARWIGIPVGSYRKWPARLPPLMADRVVAAVLRRETATALQMTPDEFFRDYRGQAVLERMLARVAHASVLVDLLQSSEYLRTDTGPKKPQRGRPGKPSRITSHPQSVAAPA